MQNVICPMFFFVVAVFAHDTLQYFYVSVYRCVFVYMYVYSPCKFMCMRLCVYVCTCMCIQRNVGFANSASIDYTCMCTALANLCVCVYVCMYVRACVFSEMLVSLTALCRSALGETSFRWL